MTTTPQPAPTAPTVATGLATILGLATTILGAIGAIVAGIDGNDTATVTAAIGSILAALTTIGGRMAQAVAAIRTAADQAAPWIDAVQDALHDESGEPDVPGYPESIHGPADVELPDEPLIGELPTDEEEFADEPDDLLALAGGDPEAIERPQSGQVPIPPFKDAR